MPSWQAGLTFTAFNPATGKAEAPAPLTGRGVPDVAGNASLFSGCPIVVYGVPFQVGGTSAAFPRSTLFALIAMIAANSGGPLGYLNPALYQIGNTAGQKPWSIFTTAPTMNSISRTSPNSPFSPLSTPCTAYVSTKG